MNVQQYENFYAQIRQNLLTMYIASTHLWSPLCLKKK